MSLFRVSAFVVDSFDFGEADRVVVLFSAEYGCKRAVARGARKKYSRYQGRLGLLCRSEVVWYEREGAELVRLNDAELEQSADFLLRDLELMMLAAYFAEHIVAFVPENEESPAVFRLLDKLLAELRTGLAPPLALRYFELWMLRLAGILPSLRECSACGKPWTEARVAHLADDALVCDDCGDEADQGRFLAAQIISAERFMRLAPAELADPEGVAGMADQAAWARLAAAVRRRFLGRELKSHEVMRRTLEN